MGGFPDNTPMRQARDRLNRWLNLTFGRNVRLLLAETKAQLVALVLDGSEEAAMALRDLCQDFGLSFAPDRGLVPKACRVCGRQLSDGGRKPKCPDCKGAKK